MAAYQDLKLYIETYSSRPYILMGHFKISEVFLAKLRMFTCTYAIAGGLCLTASLNQ